MYGYNYTWITVDDRKAMVFNVKACNDAHVALSSQLGITYLHTYEIVLGAYGNSMSLIRNATQGNPWVALDTPGIVNCTEMRKFWVGWGSGLIRVGRGGEVGMDQIMHWQDPNPYAVHGLGISSGWGAIATWQFSYIQGLSIGDFVCVYANISFTMHSFLFLLCLFFYLHDYLFDDLVFLVTFFLVV